jgi:hypothetical protein
MDLLIKLSTLLRCLDGMVFPQSAAWVRVRYAPGLTWEEVQEHIKSGLLTLKEADEEYPWFFGKRPSVFAIAEYEPYSDGYIIYRYGIEEGIKAKSKRMNCSIFEAILAATAHEVRHRVQYLLLGIRFSSEDADKTEEEAAEIELRVIAVWRNTRSFRKVAKAIRGI